MKALATLLLPALLTLSLALSAPASGEDTIRAAESAAVGAETASAAEMPALTYDASDLDGGPLEALKPFIGRWEIEAQWADGSTLHSRNEYEVRLGGKFVFARTWVKNEDGSWYQRYESVFGHEEGKGMVTYGFTYDGTFSTMDDIRVSEEDGKTRITFYWEGNGVAFRQSVIDIDGDSYSWQVFMKSEGADDYIQLMDGVWKRFGGR